MMAKGRTKGSSGAEAKVSSGVRKQLRRLERQLAEAARIERKRLRKLERARYRRQLIEATLDGLRDLAPTKPAAASALPAVTTKSPAVPSTAKPRTPRPATPRRTAPKRPPAGPATPPSNR